MKFTKVLWEKRCSNRRLKSLKRYSILKRIQDCLGFWIPRYGFRFTGTGFWILCSKFAGFRILQANFHLHRAKEPWSNFSSNLKPYIKAWKVVIAYRKAEKKIKKLMLLPKFPLFDIKVNLKLYFMFLTIMTNIGSEKWLEVSFKEMFAIMAKILRVLTNYS